MMISTMPSFIRAFLFCFQLLLLLSAPIMPTTVASSGANNDNDYSWVVVASSSSSIDYSSRDDGGSGETTANTVIMTNSSISKDDRIINGEKAEKDRYPYSVSLHYRGHFCGGSLIGNDVVLTAAHCVYDNNNAFSVRIGSDNIEKGELIEARRVVIHPEYTKQTDVYDMALIFLERSYTTSASSLDNNIPLVRINNQSSFPSAGTTVIAMGWGDTDVDEDTMELPGNLQEVDLEVITNQQCNDAKNGGDSYTGWIYDSMLCTYSEGKDACQGDSGGPLIVRTNDNPEDDVQVGIVSWGVGCAYMPGVFSRISEAYEWTVNTVCDEDDGSNDPPESLCGPAPAPSYSPTTNPSSGPTLKPTRNPTRKPTRNPTRKPTRNPTRKPTRNPTRNPTRLPTYSPNQSPTGFPTINPTQNPTPPPTSSPTQSR